MEVNDTERRRITTKMEVNDTERRSQKSATTLQVPLNEMARSVQSSMQLRIAMKRIKNEGLSPDQVEDTCEIENEIPEGENKSEYEKMVQKNREERNAFLEALGINEIKAGLNSAIQNLKPKPKQQKIKRFASDDDLPPPRRKSLRLAKLDPSEIGKVLIKAEKEPIFKEELPAVLPFKEALKGKSKQPFSSFSQDFYGLKMKKADPYNKYVSRFSEMKISETQIAKVVPGRITALAIHPICEKSIFMAGDKYGNLGIWNMSSDSYPYVFTPHMEGITNLKTNPFHPNLIISSSYDGRVRCGDLEKYVFNEVHYNSKDCCTYFDVISPTTYLVAHKSGNVAVVDHRSNNLSKQKKRAVKKHHCHDYNVKSVCVHPIIKNYFLSSDVKGSIALWDLRKLQKQPVSKVHKHQKSCNSAYFSPHTGNSILSTSVDDTICVFDSSNLLKDIPLTKVIRHSNFSGRWLSVFRATWLPNVDDTFMVGRMMYPRRIEIYNTQGSNIYNFISEHLNSITSLHAFHPYKPLLAGGNSSGKVFVFVDST